VSVPRHILALLVVAFALVPATASAHTTTDVVAVAVGDDATVRLQPTHGCGGSPTVEVRIRAPFEGAVAGAVEGWTTSAEPDGDGNTVLAWTGGVLPVDDKGSFPIEFVVPGTPGDLLVFPAVQRCENGEELAWISGDPLAEFPAPRLLVLRPGEPPAATIDDVAPDAPGRDQLVEIVDVDAATTTPTTAPTSTASTTAVPTTAVPTTTMPTTAEVSTTVGPAPATSSAPAETFVADGVAVTDTTDLLQQLEEATPDSRGPLVVVLIISAVVIVAAAVGVIVARRRIAPDVVREPGAPGGTPPTA
jgi:uncharacterized protein YcnI